MIDIFNEVQNFCNRNYYIDVDDKIPIFLCSIGGHIFNCINKCSRCDFDPDKLPPEAFAIHDCPLRHDRAAVYTPMSRLADTRINILIRGPKGSGKNVLIDLFCAENTGLLFSANAPYGEGFKTMVGPNSVTEAGMFGSVNEEGDVMGRPLARELCGGFLCFEEFSSLTDASKKEHSMDMKNQMLTSLDSGRVNKGMRGGWVRYHTRYTMWAGTQPARFELESGLDRRFFIIDIEMTPEREREYKIAQNKQAAMSSEERVALAEKIISLREWFKNRMTLCMLEPPTGIIFDEGFENWVLRDDVRSFEADLFRRLAIGYWMMQPEYSGGCELIVSLDERLEGILNQSLSMRRSVMDADLQLIKSSYWQQDIPKSTLVKEIARIVTGGDYQSAKRWIEENLISKTWYREFVPKSARRGRKGVVCRFGPPNDDSDGINEPVDEKEWG
tara:strand:- start:6108 stop:7439 length:1332 start_codon:yes stop_codon:yes gene_type:complete